MDEKEKELTQRKVINFGQLPAEGDVAAEVPEWNGTAPDYVGIEIHLIADGRQEVNPPALWVNAVVAGIVLHIDEPLPENNACKVVLEWPL